MAYAISIILLVHLLVCLGAWVFQPKERQPYVPEMLTSIEHGDCPRCSKHTDVGHDASGFWTTFRCKKCGFWANVRACTVHDEDV